MTSSNNDLVRLQTEVKQLRESVEFFERGVRVRLENLEQSKAPTEGLLAATNDRTSRIENRLDALADYVGLNLARLDSRMDTMSEQIDKIYDFLMGTYRIIDGILDLQGRMTNRT